MRKALNLVFGVVFFILAFISLALHKTFETTFLLFFFGWYCYNEWSKENKR